MKLTQHEQAMARGDMGAEVKRAIEQQIKVGEFWGAERFVEVTNVHMMGDIEVMGDGGLEHLDCMAKRKARCVVPMTTNARCFDFAHVEALGQDAGEAEKEKQLIAHLRSMDVITSDTCINYQTLYQPHFGEHVAWGDTGTVIYANSVFGARTNFESGPAAMAAAMTGARRPTAFTSTSTARERSWFASRRICAISRTGARSASSSDKATRIISRCRCSMASIARRARTS